MASTKSRRGGGSGSTSASASAGAGAGAGFASASAFPFATVQPVETLGPNVLEPDTSVIAVLGHAAVSTLAVAALRHHFDDIARGDASAIAIATATATASASGSTMPDMGDITVAPLVGFQPGDGWVQGPGPTTFLFRSSDPAAPAPSGPASAVPVAAASTKIMFEFLSPVTVFVARKGRFKTGFDPTLERYRVFAVDMDRLAREGLLLSTHFVQNPGSAPGKAWEYPENLDQLRSVGLGEMPEDSTRAAGGTSPLVVTDVWVSVTSRVRAKRSASAHAVFYSSADTKVSIPLGVFSSPAWWSTLAGSVFVPPAKVNEVMDALKAKALSRSKKAAVAVVPAAAPVAAAAAAAGSD
jgi:hypothetical protein